MFRKGGNSKLEQKNHSGHMSWIQFALLGVGFTTGTGYFLGSSMAIEKAGLYVILEFVLAAIGTYIVFDALAQLFVNRAEEGSFRVYAKQAFGPWAGFCNGWIYWISEILILGSTLTALGIFTQYWLPSVSLWILSSAYAVAGVFMVAVGVRGFARIENVLSGVKVAAILVFIGVALYILISKRADVRVQAWHTPSLNMLFGGLGAVRVWTSLIFCFYAFGGIEVLGLMATELDKPKHIFRAGRLMMISLTVLYVVSVGFATLLIPKSKLNGAKSPFMMALQPYQMSILVHVFNGVFIVAGFSVLIASLYSVTRMLVSLAEDGDAPRVFRRKPESQFKDLPLVALSFTTFCLLVSLFLTMVVPKHVYEHITTAAGIMLMYTWAFILLSHRRILNLGTFGHLKFVFGLSLIGLAVIGTVFDKASQIGFFVSVVVISLIATVAFIKHGKSVRMLT